MGIADRMRPKRTTVQRIRGASHLDRCRAGTVVRDIPPSVKQAVDAYVRARDNHRCTCCPATTNLTIAHIIPHAQGGRYIPENLRLKCIDCHMNEIGRANRLGARLLRGLRRR